MTDRLLRSLARDRLIRSDSRSRLLRGGKGATGEPAAQDVGVALIGGPFQASQKIDIAILGHAESWDEIVLFSRSGTSGNRTWTVLVDDASVASLTVNLAPGGKQIIDLTAAGEADAVVSIRLSNPADGQLTDFLATLRST